ncbi:uncharacterized protein LOC132717394 [Ruditapes philippinarum]|uniref:uncharacterized protein LOC132717394 n=1 Tax=Ruditapes philippinarum TaxID=129788 RepID=UPI00295B67B8|nr:uncharacterized protein LOC132717394 [Ruditapes philippinarum]
MVKRCQWGLCKSDSRFPDRLVGEIKFIPFPKPKRNRERCLRWNKACGRPHDQLNVEKIDGNYNLYVCTKHFPEGGPSEQYPDPYPADSCTGSAAKHTPCRAPPKPRPMSEPPKKRRKILSQLQS